MSFLTLFTVVIFLVTVISLLNERFLKIPNDIALLILSFAACAVLRLVGSLFPSDGFQHILNSLGGFSFEAYLLDGVLCFMLFAGSSRVSVTKFRQNLRPIGLLALLGTVVSSAVYGLIFFAVSFVFHMNMDLWTCILLGCIVSPTDPIAATGILNKLGMSKNVTSVIECESLFNDGTGVALFLFVKGILSQQKGGNFFYIMGKELFGAIFVAVVVSFLLFSLLKLTGDPVKHILISLTDVMLVYVICEHLGFSGVIASVVCGMCFAYMRNRASRKLMVQDPDNLYDDFWEVVDGILNAVLFMLLGLSVMNAKVGRFFLILIPAAIVTVLLSRYAGVRSCTLFMEKGRIPGNDIEGAL